MISTDLRDVNPYTSTRAYRDDRSHNAGTNRFESSIGIFFEETNEEQPGETNSAAIEMKWKNWNLNIKTQNIFSNNW